MKLTLLLAFLVAVVISVVSCSNRTSDNIAYKDGVKRALEQGELTDVSVAEDRDKNTVTLSGTVHSDDAKQKAAQLAKSAAGDRIIVNEISIRPVGALSLIHIFDIGVVFIFVFSPSQTGAQQSHHSQGQ